MAEMQDFRAEGDDPMDIDLDNDLAKEKEQDKYEVGWNSFQTAVRLTRTKRL